MINLRKVENEEKGLLFNYVQKYLYEMTFYYEDDMDDEGNYQYEYFENYFVDEDRHALFITFNEEIVGFVMVNKHSIMDIDIDYAIAEFTIFPVFRKNHIASEVMKMLFIVYQGKWEIKYSKKNEIGMKLWRNVTIEYNPEIYSLCDEEALVFDTQRKYM